MSWKGGLRTVWMTILVAFPFLPRTLFPSGPIWSI